MYNDPIAAADADAFLSRADAVARAVAALRDGHADAQDTDALLASLEADEAKKAQEADPALRALREERRKKEEEERLRRGVKGQGNRPGYLYFCRNCFLEYELEPLPPAGAPAGAKATPKCAQCSAALETREQRMQELMGKVAQLQARKVERARRRQAYEQWRKEKGQAPTSVVVAGPRIEEVKDEDGAAASANPAAASAAGAAAASAAASSSLSTRYQSWDFWEPSSDEDESLANAEPAGPEFAAMKADVEMRQQRRAEARLVGDKANTQGNSRVKAGDYLAAVECYSRAIEVVKSEKSYYTNRALAYLHVFDYAAAAKDCLTAIDIYECFECGSPEKTRAFLADFKNARTVLKAHLRRAKALLSLGDLAGTKDSLTSASRLIADLYAVSSRSTMAEYIKFRRDDLLEVARLTKALGEKEAFEAEERDAKERQARAEQEADMAAAAGKSAPLSKQSEAEEEKVLSDLLVSLSAAHLALISPSATAAAAPAPASSTSGWSLLVPAVSFFASLLSASEGNKERVVGAGAAASGERACVDAMIKMLKQRNGAATKASNGTGASNAAPLPAASSLPQFAAALALLSPSHPSHARVGIRWRERDGFVVLGKYLSQLLARVHEHDAAAANGAAAEAMPIELVSAATRALMLLTDRENGREYLSSPTHAPALAALFIDLFSPASPSSLSASSSRGAASAAELVSLRHSCATLMANLAFQAKMRTWLSADSPESKTVLAGVYRAALGQLERCELTNAGSTKEKTPAASGSGSISASVVSACLGVALNLSTHLGCRAAMIEASMDASDASSPLSLLLKALLHLTKAWEPSSGEKGKTSLSFASLRPGSTLAELSDKVLSVLLNLCVDDFANAVVFQRLLAKEYLMVPKALLRLASSPAATSDPKEPVSEKTTTSLLPPLLVERALGLLTRGLRREHNAALGASQTLGAQASSVAPSPRPLREMVKENEGALVAVRILAAHRYMQVEEVVTAENVLAKLSSSASADASVVPAAAAAAAASFTSSASATPFRYTRATMEHASVVLATLMSSSGDTAQAVANMEWQGVSGLQILVSALESTSKNVVGNACLCIDACVNVAALVTRPELSAALPLLLAVLKDPASKAAHQNAAKAAILLGRAPNNTEMWAKLRGLEIVASIMAPSLLKPKK